MEMLLRALGLPANISMRCVVIAVLELIYCISINVFWMRFELTTKSTHWVFGLTLL